MSVTLHDPPEEATGEELDRDGRCVGLLSPELDSEDDDRDPEFVDCEPASELPPVELDECDVCDEWPGSALATAAERMPPASNDPAARYRVLRLIRSNPRSRDALEGM
ncbi:MAG TPA: hypothetical protein VFZ97_15975 [Acidimicrobiales bacterium]